MVMIKMITANCLLVSHTLINAPFLTCANLQKHLFYLFIYLIQYLSRGIQFSRASLNGALTKHKNKDIKTLKLENIN